MLAFESRSAEQAFVERRNRQLVGQDVSWALFWTFMVGGGVLKAPAGILPGLRHRAAAAVVQWLRVEGAPDRAELAWLVPYFLCCPLLLAVIRCCPRWYIRHRVAAITALRLTRTCCFIIRVHRWEAVYLGSEPSRVPGASLLANFEHLSWRPMSHIAAGLGFVTPLRAFLPFQLLFLLLNLRATGQRCLAECGVGAACSAAGAATGSCPTAATEAARYYAWAMGWIRRLVPPAAALSRAPALQPSPCLGGCYSVHAWLQVAAGVLPTLCLLWGWEERQRGRELKAWRERQRQEQEQEGQGRLRAAQGGGRDPGGLSPPPPPRLLRLLRWDPPQPLPARWLAAGWVAAAWVLWLLLELLLL